MSNGTSATDLDSLLARQRRAFAHDPLPGLKRRRADLKRLRRALLAHRRSLAEAISEDFGGRSEDETLLGEIMPSVEGLKYARRHLRRWMAMERRSVQALFQPAWARVMWQPVGVTGIIAPWNYPVYLTIGPLIGALAAGCRAMIKASEYTPRTAEVLQQMLSRTFPEDHVAVVTGDAEVAAAFSRLPFDHLLFTGSTAVGRHVMRAAAENLVPVTLELGGKSPVIIAPDADPASAAEQIAFGKTFNAGQTCVAPDYVLCPESMEEEFLLAFADTVERLYPRWADNPDVTAIVSDRHYRRLQDIVADARGKGAHVATVGAGGEDLSGTRKLPVSIVRHVTDDMRVMTEELFGPILPVVPYTELEDAIADVNGRPRPLALYLFSHDRESIRRVLARTHAGGVGINDVLSHVAQESLPFGGIGPSGMGQYHGRAGFETFSKAKPVLRRPRFNSARLIYPPYGRWIHRLIYALTLR